MCELKYLNLIGFLFSHIEDDGTEFYTFSNGLIFSEIRMNNKMFNLSIINKSGFIENKYDSLKNLNKYLSTNNIFSRYLRKYKISKILTE